MDTVKEWIGSLTEQALNQVIENGIEGTVLNLGRKCRVTYGEDGSNLRASVEAERAVQVLKVGRSLLRKLFRILLMRSFPTVDNIRSPH